MRFILVFLLVPIIYSCEDETVTSSSEMKFNHLTNSASYYSQKEWIAGLNYPDSGLYYFETTESGIPIFDVEFGESSFPLFFDFGNSEDLLLTTELRDKIVYTITDEKFYNYNGTINPDIKGIIIPEVTLFNKKHLNVHAMLEDWRTYSSHPFNGAISMDYLNNSRFTIDYKRKLVAITSESFPSDYSINDFERFELIKLRYHENKVYFLGKLNNQDQLIFFDTGRNITAIHKNLIDPEKIVTDTRGDYFNGTVNLRLGEIEIEIQNPRVEELGNSIDYDYSLGITLGSDMLQYFILTIDRTNSRNFLMIHK